QCAETGTESSHDGTAVGEGGYGGGSFCNSSALWRGRRFNFLCCPFPPGFFFPAGVRPHPQANPPRARGPGPIFGALGLLFEERAGPLENEAEFGAAQARIPWIVIVVSHTACAWMIVITCA